MSTVDPSTPTAAGTTAEPTAPDGPSTPAPPATTEHRRPPADRFMRTLLRLDDTDTATAAEARSAFQKSLLFTTCRCLLMYIILPFVLPLVGIARGVGPVIGITIGILAMISIVYSIRRFWKADHSKRWHYTIFGTVIIGFLIYLTVKDLITLTS